MEKTHEASSFFMGAKKGRMSNIDDETEKSEKADPEDLAHSVKKFAVDEKGFSCHKSLRKSEKALWYNVNDKSEH